MKAKEIKALLDAKSAEVDALVAQIDELKKAHEKARGEFYDLRRQHEQAALVEKQARWKPSFVQQEILDCLSAGEKLAIGDRWRAGGNYYYWVGKRKNPTSRTIETLEDVKAVRFVGEGFRVTHVELTDYGRSKARVTVK